MEIKEMKELLKSNVCEVVFTKSDGTERVMKATLQSNYIPVVEKTDDAPKRTRKANDNVISCYDVEKSGWRSFRIDSVKSFCVIK